MSRKQPGKSLQTGAACKPFRDHLEAVGSTTPSPTAWSHVEAGFLDAMAQFDASVARGEASEGERQNGKGDYFNELLAYILEASSGRILTTRRLVEGFIFANHNLDVTYPTEGIAEVLVEAKMLGTPKHPGSDKEKPVGRDGSADLLKRAKELAFKAVDLKAGFGLVIEEAGGHQAPLQGDLAQWSKQSKPRTYFLLAVRVVDARDLRQSISIAAALDKLLDGVGLYAYTNDHLAHPAQCYVRARYKDISIPRNLELRTVLHSISNVLRSLPVSGPPASLAPEILPKTVPPPPEASG